MGEQCFRLDPDSGIVPIAGDEVKTDGGRYWVDLTDSAPEKAADWLRRLGVAPSVVTLLSELPAVPRVFEVGSVVMVQVPMLVSPDEGLRQYVTMMATANSVLTVQEGKSHLAERRIEQGPSPSVFPELTPAGFINELVDISVEHGLTLAGRLRERVLRLQDIVDEAPATLDIGEILEVKRQIGRAQAALEDQVLCAESLAELESGVVDVSPIRHRLVAGARTLDHLVRRAERGKAQLDEIHHHASLAAQETGNRRLNAITMVQAIFVPLTLLTGIYGMNFVVLPELNGTWSYFVVMIGTVLVAGGGMLHFGKRGWFD